MDFSKLYSVDMMPADSGSDYMLFNLEELVLVFQLYLVTRTHVRSTAGAQMANNSMVKFQNGLTKKSSTYCVLGFILTHEEEGKNEMHGRLDGFLFSAKKQVIHCTNRGQI